MKIIRPENNLAEKKIDDDLTLLIDDKVVTPFDENAEIEISFDEKSTIENLMEEVINDNKIKVEITFTKKQYEQWEKNGGIKWLKTIL